MRSVVTAIGLVLATSALADDRRDVPQEIYNKSHDKITYQTSFLEFTSSGAVRWFPRAIDLVTFVKSPSHDEPDTALYAMIYKVEVGAEDEAAMHATTCQVVVVFKDSAWDEPTVVCEPVDVGRPDNSS